MFSSLFSAVTKLFKPVTNVATRIGSAIFGVGSVASTASAATGASMASGGLSGFINGLTGGGVLGNVLTGAIRQAGFGALTGAAVGALTGDVGRGALMGGIGGAISGGVMGARGMNTNPLDRNFGQQMANTTPASRPTGMAPTGATSSPRPTGLGTAVSQAPAVTTPSTVRAPVAAPQRQGGGIWQALFGGGQDASSLQQRGSVLSGIGGGLMQGLGYEMQERGRMKRLNREIEAEEAREQRIRDSYSYDRSDLMPRSPSAHSGGYSRGTRYRWDPASQTVVAS